MMATNYEPSIFTHALGPSKEEKTEERRRADERSLAPYEQKEKEMSRRGGRGGRGGGGGMNPVDIEKVPGKRPLKFKKGGTVKLSASKRADGCAQRGKTRGRMV